MIMPPVPQHLGGYFIRGNEMKKRYLILENGSVYEGEAFGAAGDVSGDLVFTTGMTGYQETITDQSYLGQMIVFTYPLIGNYGVNDLDYESHRPAATAIITADLAERPSNWRSKWSLPEWAEMMDLPGITGVDTRALTKELRQFGTMKANLVDQLPADTGEASTVITTAPRRYEPGETPRTYDAPDSHLHVALIDFGLKNAIIQSLNHRGVTVSVFSPATTVAEILAYHPDGVLLSNGPGDPVDFMDFIPKVKQLQEMKPLFGICLGHQLFAIANGAKTYQMKYGHRGFNHAVRELGSQRTYFTSQNHGYAVDKNSVATTDLVVTYEDINDGSVEGVKLPGRAAFSVQFHPDATPGPHDAAYLFDEFVTMMTEEKIGVAQ